MSESDAATCPTMLELDNLLLAVRQRFSQLTDDDCQRRSFLSRLRALGRFDAEPMDYEEPEDAFLPKELEIAFAVCHPECGNQAFIVLEGGPQCCDRCGEMMYPVKFGTFRQKRK